MKKLPVITALFVAMLLVACAYAVVYFTLKKPATFNFSVNTYGAELYVEPANAVTIVANLTFPSLMQGHPTVVTSASNTAYLFATVSARLYTVQWTCLNLPANATLVAKRTMPGNVTVIDWAKDTPVNMDLVLPNSTMTGIKLWFVLTPGSNTPVGDYSFNVNIDVGGS